MGQWYDLYEPLQSIKQKLFKLKETEVEWWKLRSDKLSEKVQYPYSASKDEWVDEIINLHQLIIEGFEEKWLRKKVIELGGNPDSKSGSLKHIEMCLIGFNFDKDRAYKIMSPFHELNDLRNKLKAHASGREALELSKKAIEEFGSYFGHFTNLCKELDESLNFIISAFLEN